MTKLSKEHKTVTSIFRDDGRWLSEEETKKTKEETEKVTKKNVCQMVLETACKISRIYIIRHQDKGSALVAPEPKASVSSPPSLFDRC